MQAIAINRCIITLLMNKVHERNDCTAVTDYVLFVISAFNCFIFAKVVLPL